jgi:hypothetical protein
MLEGNRGHRSITNKAFDEPNVKVRNALAIGFAISLVSDFTVNATQDAVKPADPHHHRYVHRRVPAVGGADAARTVAPPRVSGVPRPAPYLPVQNDSDGLSRDPEDCNMGCLDSVE